ncbi:hypothetical protein HK104_003650 [Borealophlyctis nickersoniae]|nr:hypothetical protein HK104_003650 [Borealophlyctis nickersoniae]
MSANLLRLSLFLTYTVGCCLAATPPASLSSPILLFRRNESLPDLDESTTSSRLILTPEGESWLRSVPAPFSIISVVGPTRTGKSLLLNNLVRLSKAVETKRVSKEDGPFSVGKGVTSHTHGLWVWPVPVDFGNGVDTYLVDSEGIHGVETVQVRVNSLSDTDQYILATAQLKILLYQSTAYEVELFLRATTISSAVIYNTWYPVDANHIKTIKRLAAFSRLFSLDATLSATDNFTMSVPPPSALLPPTFHWTVQNFNKHTLAAQNWTAAEFLDQIVTRDAFLEDRNVDVRLLKGMFEMLEMVPMARPCDDDAVLAGIGQGELQVDQWRKDYASDLMDLYTTLRQHIHPIQLNGEPISGPHLLTLLKAWSANTAITIPEHTSWHTAVHLKLDHESARLLHAFDQIASTFIPSANTTYEAYSSTLQHLAQEKTSTLVNAIKAVGTDPSHSPALASFEKTVTRNLEMHRKRYGIWARSHVAALGDSIYDSLVHNLEKWTQDPYRVCRARWVTSLLESDIDGVVERALESGTKVARQYLAPETPEEYIRDMLLRGTELEERKHVQTLSELKRRITRIHRDCPSPLRPVWDAIVSVSSVLAPYLGVLSACAAAYAGYIHRTFLVAHASRILMQAVYMLVPPVLAVYAAYVLTQVTLLGREWDGVDWTGRRDVVVVRKRVEEVAVHVGGVVLVTATCFVVAEGVKVVRKWINGTW